MVLEDVNLSPKDIEALSEVLLSLISIFEGDILAYNLNIESFDVAVVVLGDKQLDEWVGFDFSEEQFDSGEEESSGFAVASVEVMEFDVEEVALDAYDVYFGRATLIYLKYGLLHELDYF